MHLHYIRKRGQKNGEMSKNTEESRLVRSSDRHRMDRNGGLSVAEVLEDYLMADKVNIYVKEPQGVWHKDTIDNTLKAFQKVVGGYIEVVTLERNTVIVCNEEGLLNWMPYNCTIGDRQFFGTILMCKTQGEEFTSAW